MHRNTQPMDNPQGPCDGSETTSEIRAYTTRNLSPGKFMSEMESAPGCSWIPSISIWSIRWGREGFSVQGLGGPHKAYDHSGKSRTTGMYRHREKIGQKEKKFLQVNNKKKLMEMMETWTTFTAEAKHTWQGPVPNRLARGKMMFSLFSIRIHRIIKNKPGRPLKGHLACLPTPE